MTDSDESQTDELPAGDPVKRLEEIQKQASIVAEEIDNSGAATYAERAGACAESALVLLQGPDILDSAEEGEPITDGGQRVDGDSKRDPTEIPAACSKCGVHIGAFGDQYCDPCAREIGVKPPIQRCVSCGRDAPGEEMKTIDVSPDDEYYPEIRHLCRNCSGGEHGSA